MKKLLLLLLLPFTLLSQNSWIDFEVKFDQYAPSESNFYVVNNLTGDTSIFYQPTTPYEQLDTTLNINAGSYTVYLTDSYGDFVLLTPPLKTNTFVLWIFPFLLLLISLFLIYLYNKNSNKRLDGSS